MFRIYHSNSLELQKDLLVEMIRREPLANPFSREQILVQSPGMAQWLKLELAERLGIAANIEFPLPASFLWRIFTQVLSSVPERSAFNKEAMTWLLVRLLPDYLPHTEFLPLQQYLRGDDDGYKLYQLSAKVADIFDQYLVYRPDWIAAWEAGDSLPDITESQPWQPVLWQAVVAEVAKLGQPHWHRGNMFNDFLSALRSGAFDTSQLPERVYVFGISALPGNFIEALQALGKQIDVHLMVNNPCRYFWGDIVDPKYLARLHQRWLAKPGMTEQNYYSHGNPLLSSMGKLGRDYLYQLQELGAQTLGIEEVELFESPLTDTRQGLLQHIQHDILHLDDPAANKLLSDTEKRHIDSRDNSLMLHSAHSHLREVEVLYDQLLAMLDEDHTLTPRDIIVMVPDVATYAPYIEAVFGNAPAGRYIGYSISDRTAQQESPLLMSFFALLSLPQSRLTVSDVLAILEVPAVLRRFQLDEAGFERLRRWIDQTNIRWGLDSRQRSGMELPAFEQNSWQFGLKRMLAGYAMGGSDELWQGIDPYAEIEGIEARDLGQLAEFIELLEFCLNSLSEPRSIEEWLQIINHLLSSAYAPDAADEIILNQIREALENLSNTLQENRFTAPLSAQVFNDWLQEHLGSQRSSQRFLAGAVNFCTLMPMRAIPFRVVCLLGMNDSVYPRSIAPVGFDLMVKHTRRGDRSRRDDDRYLFLEALLSAQERLYISYLGRSAQDNSPRVPSVLVSELLEYCQQNYIDEQGGLAVTEFTGHPLQPFNPAYFGQNPELFSYADEWLPAAGGNGEQPDQFLTRPLDTEALPKLELKDLLAFARNPVKHFFQRRLQVYFLDHSIVNQDEEPFQLDGLEGYQLKQRLLLAALSGDNLNKLLARVEAAGELPYGLAGQLQTRKLVHDCQEMAQKMEAYFSADPQRRECRLTLSLDDGSETELTGWLDDYHENRLLRYRPAHAKGRDMISLWLEHLVSMAHDNHHDSWFFGLNGRHGFKMFSATKAREHLQDWINLYQRGLCEPLPLPADTAWEWLNVNAEKGPETAAQKAESRFNHDAFSPGESADAYIARVFPEYAALGAEFIRLTEQCYQPMLTWYETSNEQDADD